MGVSFFCCALLWNAFSFFGLVSSGQQRVTFHGAPINRVASPASGQLAHSVQGIAFVQYPLPQAAALPYSGLHFSAGTYQQRQPLPQHVAAQQPLLYAAGTQFSGREMPYASTALRGCHTVTDPRSLPVHRPIVRQIPVVAQGVPLTGQSSSINHHAASGGVGSLVYNTAPYFTPHNVKSTGNVHHLTGMASPAGSAAISAQNMPLTLRVLPPVATAQHSFPGTVTLQPQPFNAALPGSPVPSFDSFDQTHTLTTDQTMPVPTRQMATPEQQKQKTPDAAAEENDIQKAVHQATFLASDDVPAVDNTVHAKRAQIPHFNREHDSFAADDEQVSAAAEQTHDIESQFDIDEHTTVQEVSATTTPSVSSPSNTRVHRFRFHCGNKEFMKELTQNIRKIHGVTVNGWDYDVIMKATITSILDYSDPQVTLRVAVWTPLDNQNRGKNWCWKLTLPATEGYNFGHLVHYRECIENRGSNLYQETAGSSLCSDEGGIQITYTPMDGSTLPYKIACMPRSIAIQVEPDTCWKKVESDPTLILEKVPSDSADAEACNPKQQPWPFYDKVHVASRFSARAGEGHGCGKQLVYVGGIPGLTSCGASTRAIVPYRLDAYGDAVGFGDVTCQPERSEPRYACAGILFRCYNYYPELK